MTSVSPPERSLADAVERRIVRKGANAPDWSVSHAWASLDPRYRRAIVRCIDPAGDLGAAGEAVIPAEHFTLFMEVFPPGCEGGLHQHPDAEEVYVVLEGQGVHLRFQDGERRYVTRLQRYDVASVPAGLFRVVCNDGPDDALVMVIFGSGRPQKAEIEPHHPMANVAR